MAMMYIVFLAATFCSVNGYLPSPPKGNATPYIVKYFNQTIDHFNFKTFGDLTFSQRYLIQDQWWRKGSGPIFFYTGNEGNITDFWAASGFVQELAPMFGALLVFAEHRYYGESLPFGNNSFDLNYVGWLTVEQALADYAVLISYLKQSLLAPDVPVITFGGSYGGMLSAYMRFKYPNLVTGSLAASAPIYMLDPNFDRTFFFSHVTSDFALTGGDACVNQVKKAFHIMDQLVTQGIKGLETLTTDFQLCSPLVDSEAMYQHLQGWVRNSFTYLAMLDYPYPTDFLGFNMPANPVKVACDILLNATDPVKGLAAAAGLFYQKHMSHNPPCYDMMTDFIECADPTGCGTGPNSMAWDYQACTEITLPAGSNGQTDMFPNLPFTEDMRVAYCKERWGVTPRVDWSGVQFWGKMIKGASNIIFSNGDLDPWSGGGVTQSLSDSLIAVLVKGGAHHLDLRGSNKLDPPGVISARESERSYIQRWITAATKP